MLKVRQAKHVIRLSLVVLLLLSAAAFVFAVPLPHGPGASRSVAIILSFEDCVAAGNPVMESYPEQCRTPDGQTFVRDIRGNQGPCIQVITYARNPGTGRIAEFPTPCDVPPGWEIVSSHEL
jgi:hypothetical protein